jgi:hypothetical protein
MNRVRELELVLQLAADALAVLDPEDNPIHMLVNNVLSKRHCVCPAHAFPHAFSEDCFRWHAAHL